MLLDALELLRELDLAVSKSRISEDLMEAETELVTREEETEVLLEVSRGISEEELLSKTEEVEDDDSYSKVRVLA